MFGSIVAAAALSLSSAPVDSYATMYDPRRDPRPIATAPAQTINGRLWVSPPSIGPAAGPVVPQFGPPGPEYYGALDAIDARVPVRVGHLVVSISPWERIDKPGLRRFEEARQFWLYENNFTGGVRTFVNDMHLWDPPQAQRAEAEDVQTFTRDARTLPQPRATIQLRQPQPRKHPPLRVHNSGGPAAVVALGDAPFRISWPAAAPVQVVKRSQSAGYSIVGAP